MAFEADDGPGFACSGELEDGYLAVVRAFHVALAEDIGDAPCGNLLFADDQFHKSPQGLVSMPT